MTAREDQVPTSTPLARVALFAVSSICPADVTRPCPLHTNVGSHVHWSRGSSTMLVTGAKVCAVHMVLLHMDIQSGMWRANVRCLVEGGLHAPGCSAGAGVAGVGQRATWVGGVRLWGCTADILRGAAEYAAGSEGSVEVVTHAMLSMSILLVTQSAM